MPTSDSLTAARSLHILLIHQSFASHGEAGGTRHYEFACQLGEMDHSFTIIAGNASYLTGKRVEPLGAGAQSSRGVRIVRTYAPPLLHRNYVWRTASFLAFTFASFFAAMRIGKCDLVMGTTPPLFQAVSAWLVAAVRRRPFLLEVRDLWPEFAIGLGVLSNPVLIRLARWLEGFLYRRARHIVVNSPAYRTYLIGKGVPETKITVVSNGVDPKMFDPGNRGHDIRESHGLCDKFVVTYAGALGLANDLPTLLRAAARLKDRADIHFLMVGDGKERSGLEEMARSQGLHNVTFTGAQPKTQMPSILAASDACVAILKDIPMFRMTYPNKVFDYMAAGRPTILAIDGVIREVIELAEGGIFVPPGDDAALADAVVRLKQDRQLAGKMGKAARDYVSQHFNRKDHALQICKLMTQLVSAKGRA